MIIKQNKNQSRKNKHNRIRSRIVGTSEKPRLNVYRSTTHVYAQVIDDKTGKTLCSSSSLEKDFVAKTTGKTKTEKAFAIGERVAKKALKLGIKEIVFDRSGYIYTGRVKQVAEGARSAGLKF